MTVFTDTHAHLYASEFDADRSEMIKKAINSGVSRLFLPNIDSSSIDGMLTLVKQFPCNCFAMIGLHPCSVNNNYEEELETVEQCIENKDFKFYGIGEIGIDLYWDKTFEEQQKDAFSRQIVLAKQHKLPIIIHTRNAFHEAYKIVKQHHDQSLKGIFHCFSGTIEEAKKVMELETFKMGIGGVLTFKNSGLEKVVAEIQMDYLVLETDAPYLAPVPHRGKRNESAYIKIIAQKLAQIKNISTDEIAEITTQNSIAIFNV